MPPTAEWVADRIHQLREVLTGQTPAAGVALRKLVGSVVVVEADSEGRKRKHLRGTFTLRIAAVLVSGEGAVRSTEPQTGGETVTLDFTDPSPWASIADAVKELYDTGMRYADIATQLRCPRSWPAKALAHWHSERGLQPPDGRTTRDRLSEDPAIAELADRAKEHWDQGLLMHEIAAALECCRDTVTAAIKYWHTSRSLPVPDGRVRRSALPCKSRPPAPDSPPG